MSEGSSCKQGGREIWFERHVGVLWPPCSGWNVNVLMNAEASLCLSLVLFDSTKEEGIKEGRKEA